MFTQLLKSALAAAAAAAVLTGCQPAESNALTGAGEEVETAAVERAENSSEPPVDAAETEEIFYADWLPDLGEAPEIDNPVWINSDRLSMEELEGKVVLVEFWTLG